MEKTMWNVDKVLPGELEKKQDEYAKQALEMARRAGTVSGRDKFFKKDMYSAQESSAKQESTIKQEPNKEHTNNQHSGHVSAVPPKSFLDNADKKIAVTPKKSSFVENVLPAENHEKKHERQGMLKKLVEEKIAKTEKKDEQARLEALYDIKTVIENEIETLRRERVNMMNERRAEIPRDVNIEIVENIQQNNIFIENETDEYINAKKGRAEQESFGSRAQISGGAEACQDDMNNAGRLAGAQNPAADCRPETFNEYISRHNARADGGGAYCENSKKNRDWT
ncbi:MAG: hypothetical protein LBR74_03815 [Eubacterium sp.]|jgi:hypothetical protein|nr:hypothetical protein [Eubacterium sp.]